MRSITCKSPEMFPSDNGKLLIVLAIVDPRVFHWRSDRQFFCTDFFNFPFNLVMHITNEQDKLKKHAHLPPVGIWYHQCWFSFPWNLSLVSCLHHGEYALETHGDRKNVWMPIQMLLLSSHPLFYVEQQQNKTNQIFTVVLLWWGE